MFWLLGFCRKRSVDVTDFSLVSLEQSFRATWEPVTDLGLSPRQDHQMEHSFQLLGCAFFFFF